jgi:glycogen synthase kinase 3 beta
LGCVIAECYLGSPLFQGASSLDQLVEIIKVLGCPSKEEILAMNPQYDRCQFPQVSPMSWERIFENISYNDEPIPSDAIDIIKNFLSFNPQERIDPFHALCHPYFDELKSEDCRMPNNQKLPDVFNFTEDEIRKAQELDLKIMPPTQDDEAN